MNNRNLARLDKKDYKQSCVFMILQDKDRAMSYDVRVKLSTGTLTYSYYMKLGFCGLDLRKLHFKVIHKYWIVIVLK